MDIFCSHYAFTHKKLFELTDLTPDQLNPPGQHSWNSSPRKPKSKDNVVNSEVGPTSHQSPGASSNGESKLNSGENMDTERCDASQGGGGSQEPGVTRPEDNTHKPSSGENLENHPDSNDIEMLSPERAGPPVDQTLLQQTIFMEMMKKRMLESQMSGGPPIGHSLLQLQMLQMEMMKKKMLEAQGNVGISDDSKDKVKESEASSCDSS